MSNTREDIRVFRPEPICKFCKREVARHEGGWHHVVDETGLCNLWKFKLTTEESTRNIRRAEGMIWNLESYIDRTKKRLEDELELEDD